MLSTSAKAELESRVIGEFIGDADGPTMIVVASIHGNEPSGRVAIERVAGRLMPLNSKLKGRVYLLVGNSMASARSVRYVDADLNRHWTRENIRKNAVMSADSSAEDREQYELLQIFRKVLNTAGDEVYVLDLHTTSAGGVPFATVGDTLRNRHFAQNLPVTILLGIEEQLEGTLLEFLNNEGTITLGFEGGQHIEAASADNHEALVVLSLVNAGILSPNDVKDLTQLHKRLSAATVDQSILEVRHREPVKDEEEFVMDPGFRNFDRVTRGQRLAANRSNIVTAPESGMILMPLYQKQGDDGFFIVRRISPFWLRVSEGLRRLQLADYVYLLPGIRKHPKHEEMLQIDTRIARFFPLQILHLLGFRRLRWRNNFLVVSRRRFDTTSPFQRPIK